jgi:ankyrin repeat protein
MNNRRFFLIGGMFLVLYTFAAQKPALPSFLQMVEQSEKQTSQEKRKLLFSRLPRELRYENLKLLLQNAKTPEESANIIKTTLATQELTLSKKELKEILKIMWDQFYEKNHPFYSDRTGIQLLNQLPNQAPSYYEELQKIMDENEFIEDARKKSVKEMQKYLDKGVDINAQGSDGNTALISASGFNSSVMNFLLENNADPKATNVWGQNALSKSVYNFDSKMLVPIVSLLIKHGATVNAGEYASLFEAVHAHNPYLVELLLNIGADPFIENSLGKTVIDYIKQWPEWSLEKIEKPSNPIVSNRYRIIKLFKDYLSKSEKNKPTI